MCNLCDKQFLSNTRSHLEFFFSHVSKCTLQTSSIFRDRFLCTICTNESFLNLKSFKKHFNERHAPSENLRTTFSPLVKSNILTKAKIDLFKQNGKTKNFRCFKKNIFLQ